MIKSMTGYSQVLHDDGHVQISVELRSLNSKFLDVSARMPKGFADKEIEVRNLLSDRLERGKISVTLEYQRIGEEAIRINYNEKLFKAYYQELKKLASSVDAPETQLFALALESPDVIQNEIREETNAEEWALVKSCLAKAVEQCDSFRRQEGAAMEKMLLECCQTIEKHLTFIEGIDPSRSERIREKIKTNVSGFFGDQGFDMNRLEQEIIFYIEKLDITEEKVRLTTHLSYFKEVLAEKTSNGKKLAFIAQEIGREINTIGSKANHAEIQKYVVSMKDELEKIKEQLNNVL